MAKPQTAAEVNLRIQKALSELTICTKRLAAMSGQKEVADVLRLEVTARKGEIDELQGMLLAAENERAHLAAEHEALTGRVDELLKGQRATRHAQDEARRLIDRFSICMKRVGRHRKQFQARGDEIRKLRHAVNLVKARLWEQLQGMKSGTPEANALWAFMDITDEDGRAR